MRETTTDNWSMTGAIKVKDVLGKKVIGKNGKSIGRITNIFIHPKELSIQGVEVDGGLLKPNEFIGKGYIDAFTNKSVLLNITPIREIKGADVVNVNGQKIGSVKEVRRNEKTNSLDSIKVDRFMKDDLLVPKKEIKEMNENTVVLK